MPLYDYRCTDCNDVFEAFKSYEARNEPEDVPCKHCGATVKKCLTVANIGYSHQGTKRTTDSFNDRLKEIKKKVPKQYHGNLDSVIR